MDLIQSYSEDLKLIRKSWTKVWVWGSVGLLLLLPLYCADATIYMVTMVFMWTVGILGQNLLIGYTGQISFGQAGFLCIGAFAFGHLSRLGLPWPLALLGAGAGAGIFGILVGFPALRLKGPYLAVATLGFGVAVYQVFVNTPVLSGGRMGLMIEKLPGLWRLSQEQVYFYVYFIVALTFTLLTYNIVSSYMGRAFIAIRDNDIAAEVLGVNLAHYKLLSFAISSFYVGVQGGLLAFLLGFLEPNMFTFLVTIDFLVAVVVGGLSMVEGAIFGAAFVVLIPQLFSEEIRLFSGTLWGKFMTLSLGNEAVPLVFGLAIILVMIFEPLGLAGQWLKIRLYFRNWPLR